MRQARPAASGSRRRYAYAGSSAKTPQASRPLRLGVRLKMLPSTFRFSSMLDCQHPVVARVQVYVLIDRLDQTQAVLRQEWQDRVEPLL